MKLKIKPTALAAVFIGTMAYAAPMYDEEGVYYSDSSHTNIVGGKSVSCYSGAQYWGQRTFYYKIITRQKC